MTGQELKELREKKGLSRDELAAMLKVCKPTLVRWEKGVYPIPGVVQIVLNAVLNQEVK